jgi:N-acetylmuramoyl-L-alanine amidase
MTLSAWAWRLLFSSSTALSVVSAALGWSIFRTPAPDAEAQVVLLDVAGPALPRRTHYITSDEAETIVSRAASPTAAASQAGERRYPVPAHAGGAGIERSIRAVEANASSPRATPQARGVVVLDPGHGRGDPGATHYLPDGSGRWDITEAQSNLRNAQLIRDELQKMGYEVYLTREGPGASSDRTLVADLYWRARLAAAVDADVFLAIHGNGARVKSISGPETWYCGRHREGAANELLATYVQRAMMDALHEYGYFPPDRGIKEDAESHHSGDFCQFVVTRESHVPAALLEFLFLSNDADAAVLVDDRSHVLMAKHVASAIDRFLEERRSE